MHYLNEFRNQQGDLNDIKFEFDKSKETVEDIVNEMMSAHLIDKLDVDLGKRFFYDK